MVLLLSSINTRDWNSIWFIFYRSVRNDVFVIKFKENSEMENERNSFCWGLKSTVSRFGRVIVYEHLKINMLVVLFSKLFMRSRRVEGSWPSSLLPLNQIKKKKNRSEMVTSRESFLYNVTIRCSVLRSEGDQVMSELTAHRLKCFSALHCSQFKWAELNLVTNVVDRRFYCLLFAQQRKTQSELASVLISESIYLNKAIIWTLQVLIFSCGMWTMPVYGRWR